ncbi:hypothetical protein ACS0TY_002279 [Phlomoides rotata]
MPISCRDIASHYFKKGAQIEISSDDDDLNGSWFAGTVIRPPKGRSNKVLVEYATLVEEGPDRRPLREVLDLVQLRPPPPLENRAAFKSDEFVDAYHDDGWWEGFITQVAGPGRDTYKVFFPRSKEQMEFKAAQLRPHRDWVEENGTWDPPLEEEEEEEKPNTTADEKIPFSPEMEVNEDAIEHQFSPGEEVEVSFDDEGFEGSWYAATVLKKIDGGKYLIEFQNLTNEDGTVLREEIDGLQMRPQPPDIGLVDRFDVHEEVDVWFNDGWWAGTISKVLKIERYTVYFKNTDNELKFEHSELRVHQDWKNGKWYIASKVLNR